MRIHSELVLSPNVSIARPLTTGGRNIQRSFPMNGLYLELGKLNGRLSFQSGREQESDMILWALLLPLTGKMPR